MQTACPREPVRGIDLMSVGGRGVSSTKVSVGVAVRRDFGDLPLAIERVPRADHRNRTSSGEMFLRFNEINSDDKFDIH